MIYKKEYIIKGKVISKDNISRIIKLIEEKHKTELYISISAHFCDDTSIEDSSLDIFENDYFNRLVIKKINVFIFASNNSCKYYINISKEPYSNYISIEESNKTIFDALCYNIEEILKSVKKRRVLYNLNDYLYLLPTLFIVGIELPYYICKIVGSMLKVNDSNIFIIMLFVTLILINFITIFVIRHRNPYNQFEFGENSVNHVSSNKFNIFSFLLYLFTNIVLPIVVGLLINKLSN